MAEGASPGAALHVLLHYLTPLLFLGWWAVFSPHGALRFRDLPFDLADASVAEAASRLRIRHVLTLDADFDIYRDKAGRALVNVLRQAI